MTAYVLTVRCDACNREPGMTPCDLCARIEDAEREATGVESPQLVATDRKQAA